MFKIGVLVMFSFIIAGCTSSSLTGAVVLSDNISNKVSWCQTGDSWETNIQKEHAPLVIKEYFGSGKYAGLCRVAYVPGTGKSREKVEYYFNETGKSGFMITYEGSKKRVKKWTE